MPPLSYSKPDSVEKVSGPSSIESSPADDPAQSSACWKADPGVPSGVDTGVPAHGAFATQNVEASAPAAPRRHASAADASDMGRRDRFIAPSSAPPGSRPTGRDP